MHIYEIGLYIYASIYVQINSHIPAIYSESCCSLLLLLPFDFLLLRHLFYFFPVCLQIILSLFFLYTIKDKALKIFRETRIHQK